MRRFFLLFAACMFLFVASPTQQTLADSVDFSGHWVLDQTASEPMEALMKLQDVPWAVRKVAEGFDNEFKAAQGPKGLTISFDNWIGDFNQELVFDAKPHTTQNPAGRKTTFSTSWSEDGATLVSSGPVDLDGAMGTLTERRSLSADKKTLTLLVSMVVSGGQSATARRVYIRQ